MKREGSLPYLQELATCSYHERDQSTPCHHNDISKIHFNVILLSTSRSSKWFFSVRLSARTLYPSLFFPIHTTFSAHLIVLDLITRKVFKIAKLFMVQFSRVSCYFLPLRSKCYPQHPVLEYPHLIFFLQFESSRCVVSYRMFYRPCYIRAPEA